jgi:hypothetical protein
MKQLKKLEREVGDKFQLVRDRVQSQTLMTNVMNVRVP